jgi:nicotinate-nucleotide pyrophosphorylase (carboxylating)
MKPASRRPRQAKAEAAVAGSALAPRAWLLSPLAVAEAVRAALGEDLGRAGDITTAATIPADATARAAIVARKAGVLAGLPLAENAFRQLDPGLTFTPHCNDGDPVAAATIVADIAGNARALLSAERVALNFLCHLSGIATATAGLVARVAHTRARICDTRKTLPGMRTFEKYAVRCGGGVNHRFGLDDAILIKDNHIAVVGGVAEAVRRARAAVGHLVKIEVEVDTLAQLDEALTAAPDAVLVDNMPPAMLRDAVAMVAGRATVEASGGITPDSVAAVAETGVDMISSGWLTHSAPALDLALDFAAVAARPHAQKKKT